MKTENFLGKVDPPLSHESPAIFQMAKAKQFKLNFFDQSSLAALFTCPAARQRISWNKDNSIALLQRWSLLAGGWSHGSNTLCFCIALLWRLSKGFASIRLTTFLQPCGGREGFLSPLHRRAGQGLLQGMEGAALPHWHRAALGAGTVSSGGYTSATVHRQRWFLKMVRTSGAAESRPLCFSACRLRW